MWFPGYGNLILNLSSLASTQDPTMVYSICGIEYMLDGMVYNICGIEYMVNGKELNLNDHSMEI